VILRKEKLLAECPRIHLRHTDLKGVDLRGAQLARADLRDANLTRADLANANVDGARLTPTILVSSIFTGPRSKVPI